MKLSLPFVFKKSKDSTKSSTKLVIGMILILLGFPGVMFAIAIIFLGEAEMFVQLLVGGALLVPPLILLLIGLKVALPYFLPLVENIIGIDSEQTIKSNNEREKIKPVSVKYPRVESGSEKLERGDYDHSYIESDAEKERRKIEKLRRQQEFMNKPFFGKIAPKHILIGVVIALTLVNPAYLFLFFGGLGFLVLIWGVRSAGSLEPYSLMVRLGLSALFFFFGWIGIFLLSPEFASSILHKIASIFYSP